MSTDSQMYVQAAILPPHRKNSLLPNFVKSYFISTVFSIGFSEVD